MTEQHNDFSIDVCDIRKVLIKNSINGFLGRHRDGQLILYSLISRLVLLFQAPVAIIIYADAELKNTVFISLDKKNNFGDPELTGHFYNFLNDYKGDLKDCVFRFLGTNYYFAFFKIEYQKYLEKPRPLFTAIPRYNNDFGIILQSILEESIFENKQSNNTYKTNILNIEHIYNKKTSSELLQSWLYEEFKRFPHNQKISPSSPELEIIENSPRATEFIDYHINQLKTIIEKIHKKITTSPLVSAEGISFNNFFVLVKTATDYRIGKNYAFPYTLRALLCDDQKEKITEHFHNISREPEKCNWYDSANKKCLIKLSKDNKLVDCIFNASEHSMTVEDFIDNFQKPFNHERSIIDTALYSGIISISQVPDLSRNRSSSKADNFEPWSTETNNVTKRYSCATCISHQLLPYSKEKHTKFFVSPIIVNGVTSAAFLFVSHENNNPNSPDASEWMRNLLRYLNVVLRRTRQFRHEIKKLYLNELTKAYKETVIETFIKDDEGNYRTNRKMFFKILNKKSNYLSHIYPFPKTEFYKLDDSDKNSPKTILIFKVYPIGLKSVPNDKFEKLFEYNDIEYREIKEACEKGDVEAFDILSKNI